MIKSEDIAALTVATKSWIGTFTEKVIADQANGLCRKADQDKINFVHFLLKILEGYHVNSNLTATEQDLLWQRIACLTKIQIVTPEVVIDTDFDSDAQAYFDVFNITNEIEKAATNTMVLSLKEKELWDNKLKVIHPISPTSLEAASGNLRNPYLFQITYINSPPHSIYGVDWDGLTQFGRMGLIPSIDLTDNNVHVSYYSRDDQLLSRVDMGARSLTSQTLELMPRWTGGTMYFYCYSTAFPGSISGVVSDSLGLFVGTRRSSSDAEIYQNGVSVGVKTTVAGSVPDIELYLGALNDNGSAILKTTRQCAFASVGLGLTDADVTNLNNIVKIYQQNVIPGGRAVA